MPAGRPIQLQRDCLALLWLLLAAVFGLSASTALATGAVTGSSQDLPCLAMPGPHADLERLAATPAAWECDYAAWPNRFERAVLRFPLGAKGQVPDRLATRLARLTGSRIGIEGVDGSILWRSIAPTDYRPSGYMAMSVPVPLAGTSQRAVLFAIDGWAVPSQLTQTRLIHGHHAPPEFDELFVAGLVGLLFAPLLFAIAFYRVLRERYLLWHALVVACMMVQILVTSGLPRFLAAIPADLLSYLVATSFAGGIAAALMLARHFIEKNRLEPRHHKALTLAAVWIMLACAAYVATIDLLGGLGVQLYLLAWLGLIGVIVWVGHDAVRNGSRAVRFLLAAWVPMVMVGIARIVCGIVDGSEPEWLYRVQNGAIAIYAVVISLGLTDRLVYLRRDLDRHRRRATNFERLAESDPLTGLMNRRAIEPQFARLRREGFTTFAVFDLDRFKDINDRFGHTTGDKVLQAVARAIAPTDDMLSMRLGGEEFMLLLRGSTGVRHAEWCRQALSARIAAEVEGLDRIVTASMGIVEMPAGVMSDASFAAIYARADSLLYQAKSRGRNRAVKERLSVFGEAGGKPARRKSDAA